MNRFSRVVSRTGGAPAPRVAPSRLDERGQGLVELVICIPILLLLGLGILEVGRMLETQHIMSSLTREGANIASRGASLVEALDVTRQNQTASGLGSGGGVIVSRLMVESGVPVVVDQVTSPDFEFGSRIGLPDSIATSYAAAGLRSGESYVVVELFVPYAPITPFQRFIENLVPETLYDRSLF